MSTPHAIQRIPLSRIRPDPDRPRSRVSPESVEQLAESIRLHGQLSPLLVRDMGGGDYRLISGERRLQALMQLGQGCGEAIVLSGNDCDCALVALVENIQREQLHFLDIAAACRRILDRYPITQERLAASLSCSPSALANRLRLLKLPRRVQEAVRDGGLSERHARALLKVDGEAEQLSLAMLAAEKRLSVAQLERRVEQRGEASPAPPRMGTLLRDNRMVVNALLDTVRRLSRIGVPVQSRVEEADGCVNVIVTIRHPAGQSAAQQK